MDATIIENETLDDLVKISGVKANIDETSKLAMEGKIDIKTTLSTRVNYLKEQNQSLVWLDGHYFSLYAGHDSDRLGVAQFGNPKSGGGYGI